MKAISLHIAFAALLSLLSLASCSRNDEVTVADGEEGKVYVTLTLSINGEEAGSRAAWDSEQDTDEEGVGWENEINNLQILIYDENDTYAGTVESLFGSGDRYIGTLSGTNWQSGTYKFVVLANFTATSTNPALADLASITYNQAAAYLPMYGVKRGTFTFEAGENTDIGSIDLLRAMAKVEVSFSEGFPTDYTIGNISLSPYNTQGYCVPQGYASVDNTGALDREEAGTAYSFNPYHPSASTSALTFKEENGKYYLYLPEYDNSTDAATIQVTVNGETYPLEFKNYENGTPTGDPYDIVRNHIYRYTITGVNDGELTVKYRALPWDLVTSEIGYEPQPASTTVNPFADGNEEIYAEFMKNGYILLPVDGFEEDDDLDKSNPDRYRRTVKELFRYLYDYPGDRGDDDARYCILTKPTYVDADRKILKTGTAGARYFFMLTGPEGATWEAHLSNHEDEGGDFTFSYSNSNDFNKCEDAGYAGTVKMVSHGIARPKPYIIQVNCVRSWTGTDETAATDENDKATGEYPWYEKEGNKYWDDANNESRVDDIDNNKKWKEDERKQFYEDYDQQLQDAFTYYTAWGKDNNTNERVISTKLYITVTLADGTKYNLNINPSYKDHPNKDKMDFLYQDYRRYAGGEDDCVWIRQVPAQFGWSFEELARDVDESETGYQWWRENPYWKK